MQSEASSVRQALAELWVAGLADGLPAALEAEGTPLRLPTYPFCGPVWMHPLAVAKSISASPERDEPTRAAAVTGEQPHPRDVLRGAWCEFLGRDEVDDQADFFELGGDSLTLLRIASRLSDSIGVRISVRDLIKNPIFSSQLQLLETKRTSL
jgi:phthiocerol/phenolphthiocerol synthesis type-I polyketide synthase E